MKWYERQKQMYSQQKNQTQEPQPQYDQPEVEQPIESESTYESVAYENVKPSFDNAQDIYEDVVDDVAMNQPYEPEYRNEHVREMRAQTFTSFQDTSRHSMEHEATTISKGTVLHGNIESEGDLIIHGHVKGDIICNSNLSVYGTVEGIINCNNAYFDQAIIVGDVGCSGNLELTQSSTVDGNVEAYELLNGGRIKGDAMISEHVRFTSTSAIVGNVSANDIQVDRGAVIQGKVTIRQEVYGNNR